ncbi:Glycoprotein-N-acetylgalactosamine 3-beta-galactosyltransferase 1 [Cytospora mali]|uniref:Glycoprotein-N-acetylgalactosamine 3-beta-galactosyltransferase 1 n=1 Tax=Cytospora mali TaxID=578113 RepID=A0A194VNB6_CYTMA|nr:Glycoprotein-N-acetylgalactosamine 3-beta-galactosyltransferase 1 [Valsa mali]
MLLRWRRRWRSLLNLRLVASATLGSLFLWATLPYDNAIRLSVRFNTQRLLSLVTGPFISERWLYEEPTFPVDWAYDVAIILKTGYGTQERALAWFEALPMGINPESVLVVGDFDFELKNGVETSMGMKVHDVVAGVLERRPCSRSKSESPPCPRVEKYRSLRAAISAGREELARNLSGSFGWELDAVKFLPALDLAYRTMPRKKWFILLDDDTYLIQPSLNALLGHFDPSIPYYIGNAVGDYRQRFAHGGSSITLSRAAVQKLFAGRNHRALATARRASATEVWGDRLLADALLRLGIHIEEGTGRFFNGEQPWASRLRSDRFCVPVSTFHRLTAEEMKGVGRVFRKAVDPVLWVDLWDVFHGPSFATYEVTPLRREWDHVGRLDEHTVTLTGVKAAPGCSRLCERSEAWLMNVGSNGIIGGHVAPTFYDTSVTKQGKYSRSWTFAPSYYQVSCHRLSKSCSAQIPAPPRKRKAPKPTRVAELEKKLQELTARVESRNNPPSTPSEGTPSSDSKTTESRSPPPKKLKHISAPWKTGPWNRFCYIFASDTQVNQPDREWQPSDISHNSSESPAPSQSSIQSQQDSDKGLWQDSPVPPEHGGGNKPFLDPLVADDSERLLVEYREYMEPLFPFVVIPRAMNSDQLRRERPMLWKAIMMQAMYMDPSRQVPLGNELLNDIVTACFLKPNKSFDLLQALEVLIAWLYVKLQSFQMTNMLFLMRSMCVSLGFSESQNAMKQQEHNSTSLEQMRTFAGVYYLVTMVFTTNKKPDAFMNTSYLEACCRALKEKMEYPTDEVAVYLIRTQQLSQSISMTLAFRSTSLPLSLIVKGFREQIDELRTSMPQNIKDYAAIKTQLHICEILLYEVGLNEELSASLPFTERLELLWQCLKATRSMLEARFEKSKDDRPRQTYLSSFDFTYAMLTCLKLSTINIPGWDIRLARKELDFDEFLNKQIQDLKDFVAKRSRVIKRTSGANTKILLGDLDQFEIMYKKLEKLRVSLKAELAATIPPEGASETAQVGFSNPGMDPAMELGLPGMEFPSGSFPDDLIQGLDGSFWQDVCWVNEWDPDFGALMGWEVSWLCPERQL